MVQVDGGLVARAADALAVADEDPAAQAVLAAAREAFHDRGIRATTMEDVATAAGVGRATLYRKFATRDALVEAVLLADLRSYLERLDRVMDTAGADVGEQLVEGYVATLRFVREESLLASVLEHDGDWGLRYFTTDAGPVLGAARHYLAGKLRAAQQAGAVHDLDADAVAEVLVRLCHSLMLTPDGEIPFDDDEATRRFARGVLVPIITPR